MLAKWFYEAKHTVVLTGAGMSTESGLADFRSALDGMWNEYDPLLFASRDAMTYERDLFVRFYKNRIEKLQSAKPHEGYYYLSEWEKSGHISSILTQNVDGFHKKAGSKNVAEMHGTLCEVYCDDCGESFENAHFLNDDNLCECGGFKRPGVVLFGEPLPMSAIHLAKQETRKADLFIVLGSSLSVSPANLFPVEAKRHGAKVIIVNDEETKYDSMADLVINRKIKDVLTELAEEKG